MRYLFPITLSLFLSLSRATVAVGAEPLLQLSIDSGAAARQGANRHSTRHAATEPTTLTVQAGERVRLQRSRGRDYTLQAGTGWGRSQLQQVPAETTAVDVTPSLHGDTVSLRLTWYEGGADQNLAFSTTARGPLGEWIPLLQSPADPAHGKRYRSDSAAGTLAVKVERVQ